MRIVVAVPSEDQKHTAGVRIRYHRLAPFVTALGHELVVELVDDIVAGPSVPSDVFLISKCYDARSVILASELRGRGCQVGADFFDDYYTQFRDSRFVHLRQWLGQIAGSLTFGLCSTRSMQETAGTYLPGRPFHVMNDPCEAAAMDDLEPALAAKLERTQRTGIIDIGWFGIGDNPYFDVGLSDLRYFGDTLASAACHGLQPRLTILTNRRAMTPARLALLSRLPIPWTLEEWSEEAELQLLAASYACFLPVNAQRFSTAKSLNRAVTALTAGAQVLSAGYPLYTTFDPFIYRSAGDLAADAAGGRPLVRQETLSDLLALLDRHANPAAEARALVSFIESLPAAATSDSPLYAVVHGRHSGIAIHKSVQRRRHLSIAGAFPIREINYDMTLAPGSADGVVTVNLSAAAMKHVRPEMAANATPIRNANGKAMMAIEIADRALRQVANAVTPPSRHDSITLWRYQTDMRAIEALVRTLFGGTVQCLASEQMSPYLSGLELSR